MRKILYIVDTFTILGGLERVFCRKYHADVEGTV